MLKNEIKMWFVFCFVCCCASCTTYIHFLVLFHHYLCLLCDIILRHFIMTESTQVFSKKVSITKCNRWFIFFKGLWVLNHVVVKRTFEVALIIFDNLIMLTALNSILPNYSMENGSNYSVVIHIRFIVKRRSCKFHDVLASKNICTISQLQFDRAQRTQIHRLNRGISFVCSVII